ncbi:MAG: Re/Si-specific NAD(P)(+) transhydrogenase subunit alpha [Spirochaetota bacterium]|nr:Re/Si-specific NAD(P)(+) transhydrogenase subunit alpha [Spirochaetota bacterium]
MIIGVPKETLTGENRVALIPIRITEVAKLGFEVHIETGAGLRAGFPDDDYREKGAKIIDKREDVYKSADVILQVMGPGANPNANNDYKLMKEGQIIIGFLEPLLAKESAMELAKKKVTSFAVELVPRITRAQSMDALSSMANIAGYKSVLIAANTLPKILPMMTTAGGTMTAAKTLIIGVGVAGLQAIATAKRLGSIVQAYDVRPAVKEQVQSLGAKFVELEIEASNAEDKGGYAKEMGEEFYKKQRELMSRVIAESDVVITTAAIPGKKSPILVTEEMVKGMKPGSVIVDMAAERGGNCELTKYGETIIKYDVTILGPVNIPSTVPYHASQMYSKNLTNFLQIMVKDKKIELNLQDEIIRDSMVTRNGEIVNPRVKEALGILI